MKIPLNKVVEKLLEEYNITPSYPDIKYEAVHPSQCPDFCNLWLVHMEFINSVQQYKYNGPITESIFRSSLNEFVHKHKSVKLFTARESGNLVGFLNSGITSYNGFTYGFISDLHVKEDYRGFNIGRDLMENCLDWFSSNNIKTVELEVAAGNEKVFGFYKKYGFNTDKYTLRKEI